jgi:hypothetical protein
LAGDAGLRDRDNGLPLGLDGAGRETGDANDPGDGVTDDGGMGSVGQGEANFDFAGQIVGIRIFPFVHPGIEVVVFARVPNLDFELLDVFGENEWVIALVGIEIFQNRALAEHELARTVGPGFDGKSDATNIKIADLDPVSIEDVKLAAARKRFRQVRSEFQVRRVAVLHEKTVILGVVPHGEAERLGGDEGLLEDAANDAGALDGCGGVGADFGGAEDSGPRAVNRHQDEAEDAEGDEDFDEGESVKTLKR